VKTIKNFTRISKIEATLQQSLFSFC